MVTKEAQKPKRGLGIASFILGIGAVLFSLFIPISLILAIISIILGIMQLRRNKTGFAVAGIVLSIVGIIVSIILTIVLVQFIQGVVGAFGEMSSVQNQTLQEATKTCNNIKPLLRTTCVAITVASHISDPSVKSGQYCKDQTDDSSRNVCVIIVAKAYHDEAVCDISNNNDVKITCNAIVAQDTIICSQLKDSDDQKDCEQFVLLDSEAFIQHFASSSVQ